MEAKNKKGRRRPEVHVTGPRNTREEKGIRRERRMNTSCVGGKAPERAVAPYVEWMDGWIDGIVST